MKMPTISWQEIPAVRLAAPLIFGGTCYLLFPHLPSNLIIVILLFCLTCMFFCRQLSWSLSFYVLLSLCGYAHFQNNEQAIGNKSELSIDSTYRQKLTLIDVKWDENKARWRGIARSQIKEISQNPIRVYYWIERKDSCQQIKKGDAIIGDFSLQKARPPDLPGAFDFRAYLKSKNIAYILYIPSYADFAFVPSLSTSNDFGISSWRKEMISEIAQYTDSVTQSLLQAILFGDSQSLPPHLRKTFAEAGMAHILAVSGMHVGILVLIIQFILQRILKKTTRKAYLSLFSILFSVWMYVALCEFAPSATRAAIMVSLYYLGKACKTAAPGLNTLGLSAIILFLWNPFLLLDVGAQLSFGAMLSILLTIPFWNYLIIRWTPLPKSWVTLIALSFAAQLGVAPFLLYHFGYIPLLFWLFSIPAAYLATFLFVGGWTLVFLTELLPAIAHYWGQTLDLIIACWTMLMDLISSNGLPKYQSHFYPIVYLMCSLVLIGGCIRSIYSATKRDLFLNLTYLLVICSFFVVIQLYHERKSEIQTINGKNWNLTLIKRGKVAYILGDDPINEIYNQIDQFDQLYSAYPIKEWKYVHVNSKLLDELSKYHMESEDYFSKLE